MAEEEKQAQEQQVEKAEDAANAETTEETQEESSVSKKFDIKKLVIPGAIALTALIVSFMIPQFLKSDKEPEEVAEHSQDSAAIEPQKRDSLMAEAAMPLHLSELDEDELEELLSMRELFEDIDTNAILEEMGMLDEEMIEDLKVDEVMSAQDSVDTLSWIDREMNKIEAERDSLQVLKEELKRLEIKIEKAMARLEEVESSRIVKLARLYDGMKPAEVARLFENLTDDVVLTILPRMKAGNAGKILALLKPKRAASLSTKMITVMEP